MKKIFITLVGSFMILANAFAGIIITPTYNVIVLKQLDNSKYLGIEVLCNFERYTFVKQTYDWTRKTYTTFAHSKTNMNVLSVKVEVYQADATFLHQCNPKRFRYWYHNHDRYFCEYLKLVFNLSNFESVMRNDIAKEYLDNQKEQSVREVIRIDISEKVDLNLETSK